MHRRFRGLSLAAVIATLAVATVTVATGAPSSGQTADNLTDPAVIAQGQYLVQQVARCIGCHGADLGGRAADPSNPNFVPRPKIAGLPMFQQDADAIKFFETATLPAGSQPVREPMPAFKLHHADAVAIVAYLRSLK